MTTHTIEAMMTREDEAARLMQFLARLVRMSGMSTREIGEKVGLQNSAISKILNGYTRPQAWHLLVIAAAIGLTPREFFSRAYPAEKQTGANPLGQDSAEIERRVEAAVQRALQRLGSELGEPKR
jgi:transcriptional regulator with XRE-family HTH domain